LSDIDSPIPCKFAITEFCCNSCQKIDQFGIDAAKGYSMKNISPFDIVKFARLGVIGSGQYPKAPGLRKCRKVKGISDAGAVILSGQKKNFRPQSKE
jgi:hypothetical protein